MVTKAAYPVSTELTSLENRLRNQVNNHFIAANVFLLYYVKTLVDKYKLSHEI